LRVTSGELISGTWQMTNDRRLPGPYSPLAPFFCFWPLDF